MPKILLIEDDADVRAVVRDQLIHLGHDVEEAENGKVGLDCFARSGADLVITDLTMPVMEGLETIGRLKKQSPSLKIIAMSGGGMIPAGEYLRVARKMGATQTLAKPFSGGELELVLREVLKADEKPAEPALTFVVLDDDETARALNRHLIKGEFPSSTVLECETLDAALVASQDKSVSAVITDHHLGEADGGEFIRRLRAQGTRCPVLMVTNSEDPSVHRRAYAAGAARVFGGSNIVAFREYLHNTLRIALS